MSPLWSQILPDSISDVSRDALPFWMPAARLSPDVWKDTVLVLERSRVRALHVDTGESRWPAERDDDGTLASADASAEPTVSSSAGGARSYGHVAGARYYARLESMGASGLSEVVCLDLEAEGRTVWRVASDQFRELPRSKFSGSPLVEGGRLYIALRRAEPQMEVGLACFDASSGQLEWDRRLCTDLGAAPEARSGVGDDVLAAGGGLVFQIPSEGVITACDAESGHLKWAVTYTPKLAPTEDANVDRGGALLYQGGRLFVTANDMGEVLALDAMDGRRMWAITGASAIRDLLGVSEGQVIAAGDQLWGFDTETGAAWRFGFDDPEGYGYGRGALAGRRVYWPTREELFVVDSANGSVLDRLDLGAAGLTGGNVTIAGDRLLIASPDRLTALGPVD
jgi:outer membrane protein assembly factor BamB